MAPPNPRSASPAAKAETQRPVARPAGQAPQGPIFRGAPAVSPADLTIGDEIGKGRFKQVHRGTVRCPDGGADRDVVVLRYAKNEENRRELGILSLLARTFNSDPFVPVVHGVCDDRRDLIILEEHALLGSLKAAVTDPEVAAYLSPTHKLYSCAQVARAMSFLESVRVVHADLSCRNLLLCNLAAEDPASTVVKVTDFGLALVLPEGCDHEIRKQPQATRWCAPEQIASQKLSHRSDVWSLGATLWEFFSAGETPWAKWEKRADVAARLRELAEGAAAEPPTAPGGTVRDAMCSDFPAPEGCAEAAHDLILACLQAGEHARPTFAQLADAFEALAVRAGRGADAEEEPMPAEDASADVSPTDGGLGSSTPSTLASCADGCSTQGKAPDMDEATAAFVARCDVLRDFLTSSQALDFFGEDAALEAFKAFLQSPEAQALLGERQRSSAEMAAPDLSNALPEVAAKWPTAAVRPPIVAKGAWTLQTLEDHKLLQRHEFADVAAAWAAFDAAARLGAPCMLRDPTGADVAAQSWLILDGTTLRPPATAGRARGQSFHCESAGSGTPWTPLWTPRQSLLAEAPPACQYACGL